LSARSSKKDVKYDGLHAGSATNRRELHVNGFGANCSTLDVSGTLGVRV